ncbi:MAG: GNAT family N-acetyltransferase, partial [Reinekea sp.]|nr:GNAT family N-acetyltransferase [Reinekea sp.]
NMNKNTLNGYSFVSHYADNAQLRDSLNRLSNSLWGITVLHGGEADYVPFSQTLNGDVVANVCVGRFCLVADNKTFDASMIQTVMTAEPHRNQGLIRALFQPVQEHIAQTTGRTFFSAHKHMADFYGKFGYRAFPLTDYFAFAPNVNAPASKKMQPIDLNDPAQRQQFERVAELRQAVSQKMGFVQRNWLLHWFCQYFHQRNLYWLPELEAYVIAVFHGEDIEVKDIIALRIPSWAELQPYFSLSEQTVVKFFFSPDQLQCEAQPVMSDEDWFFADEAFPALDIYCLPDTQRG